MTPIILLTACIGYFFCTFVYRLRYKIARKQNWHLFFWSMSIGGFFLLIAFSFNYFFCKIIWCYSTASIDYQAGIAALTAVLAGVAGVIINRVWGKKRSIKLSFDDDFNLLIFRSIKDSKYPKLIQFTLNTRKIYIGFVLDSFEPVMESGSFITLLPMYSGHRDKDNLTLQIDNDYSEFWQQSDFDARLLSIVIPRKTIVSANIFNFEVYSNMNNKS